MTTAAPTQAISKTRAGPLYAGYTLVALVAAWLAGIALRPVGPLAALVPVVWLVVAALCAALWLMAGLRVRRILPGFFRSADRVWRVVLVAGMLGCWLALGAARAASADPSADPRSIGKLATGSGISVYLRGTVAAEPDLRAGYRFLIVEVTSVSRNGAQSWQPATGRVEAAIYGPDDWFAPAYGDSVSLSGKLRALGSGYTPAGVVARLTGARATVSARGGGNPLLAALFSLRTRLAQAIQRALPEPEAALLIGILLGLKTPALRARLPLFTATGTIHLVVPAGLKVSTLAELATFAVRALGAWPRTLAALFTVGVYAALGGGGPAAIRAAIMGALLALAPALGRAYNVFTALALAVLAMTALEPQLLYDAGFQLTVLATLGLPLLVPPLQRRLASWLRWLPASTTIAELLAVTIAAQLATLPVLALTFHEVSLVAPLANLLTVPLLAPLLVLGALLAAAGVLSIPFAGALALALAWIVWPLLWFVDFAIAHCAALPAAAFTIPDTPGWVAWLYYAILATGLFWLAPRLRRRAALTAATGGGKGAGGLGPPASAAYVGKGGKGLLAALLALALLGATGAAVPVLAQRGQAHLDFLNVGSGGEATLLRLPSGTSVLINGGPDGPTLESALAGKLPFWRRTLDLALLTDPRAGDARGLEDAATHFHVTRAADAGMTHPSADYLAWLDAMRQSGATRTTIRQDDTLTLAPNTTLRVLAPPQPLYADGNGSTTASNDLILRLQAPGLRALLLGSADDYALDALAYAGEPLDADVVELALPANVPLTLDGPLGAVLRLAHPRLVVIASSPESPKSVAARKLAEEFPTATDADAATALGALVYRTQSAGTISLSGDAHGWNLSG